MATILALETSCDETAVAILRGRDRHSGPPIGRTRPAASSELLASEVASQIAEHEKYGGVVPEVASRNHLVHAPRLLQRATTVANVDFSQMDAFAATSGPGLASSLMIGASIAKGLAIGFAKPYLAINHLEGHLLSPFFRERGVMEPNVSLIVSGGHTLLVHVRALSNYRILGRTVDDAAGEAFDKVAKMLGLGYPGGPEIEKHARGGDANSVDFPRSMLGSGDFNFSFSGLKTAVRYALPKLGVIQNGVRDLPQTPSDTRRTAEDPNSVGEVLLPPLRDQDDNVLKNICASFQQAIVDVLVRKTIDAARVTGVRCVTLSGGVSVNNELRSQLAIACEQQGLKFCAAAPELCTDNAAMIAFAAMLRLQNGFESKVTEEIDPNLSLAI